MAKLIKPDIPQHMDWAQEIKDINYRLNELIRTMQKAYGVSSREVTLILRTKEELGKLRSRLDSNLISAYPTKPLYEINFYYTLGS
jgi:septation ring formation regulator EzrA